MQLQFLLELTFDLKYPFDAPIVVFAGDEMPVHEHVYTTGE
jgi:ubiquitin-protein ligase